MQRPERYRKDFARLECTSKSSNELNNVNGLTLTNKGSTTLLLKSWFSSVCVGRRSLRKNIECRLATVRASNFLRQSRRVSQQLEGVGKGKSAATGLLDLSKEFGEA